MHKYSSIEAANGARPRPSLALRPVLSPITPCAAVWGGRVSGRGAAGGRVALERAVP